jgi:tetratricopeptide (TPR) repeat protein
MGLLEPEVVPEAPEPAGPETLKLELKEAPAPKVRPGLEETATEVAARSGGQEPAEPELDEETQKFIAQSLTDVDLFASYGLTQKAIGLLEAILRRAPTHTPTLEKLLDFVLGAGDDRRTAELAAQLEHIHTLRGDSRGGERFGELRRRFQRAAGLTDDEITAAVAAAMPQPVETVPVEEVQASAAEELGAQGSPVEMAHAEAAKQAPVVEAAPTSEPVAEEVPEIEIIEPTPDAEAIPVAREPQAAETEEVDLSAEWASLVDETREPEAVAQVPEAAAPNEAAPASPVAHSAPAEPPAVHALPELVVEEAELSAQAEPTAHEEMVAAFEDIGKPKLEIPAETADFEEWSTPQADVSAAPKPAEPEIHAGEQLLPDEELTTLPVPEHSEVAAEGPETALELPQAALPVPPVPEPEFELDQDFELVLEPEPVVPAHEMLSEIPPSPPAPDAPAARKEPAAPVAANANVFSSEDFLSVLGKEIDELGLNAGAPVSLDPPMHEQLAMQSAEEQRLAKANNPVNAEAGPLKEVFDEFRAELGEMGAEDEDLETHYNLGIAFREMGLLEEAIGEFQKVAKANDRGKAFRYAMQCCTLLGLAFMEKGQPAIAAIWYERALQTPGIDSESKLALRYDLGVAQESAGDLDAALKSFSQVYAVNIDYRDVADRIAAHHKPAV